MVKIIFWFSAVQFQPFWTIFKPISVQKIHIILSTASAYLDLHVLRLTMTLMKTTAKRDFVFVATFSNFDAFSPVISLENWWLLSLIGS